MNKALTILLFSMSPSHETSSVLLPYLFDRLIHTMYQKNMAVKSRPALLITPKVETEKQVESQRSVAAMRLLFLTCPWKLFGWYSKK